MSDPIAELFWAYRCAHGWDAMLHVCAVLQFCDGILDDGSGR